MGKANLYGLVGKEISYSFSKKYFTEKFSSLNLDDYEYQNFNIAEISKFTDIIRDNPTLKGLNVTIPFKESIIPFLDGLSKKAMQIGAVNTIKILPGKLKGYNTDWYGFKKSLKPLLLPHHKQALILGTGGAAKAVAFALQKMDIRYAFVSRNEGENTIGYNRINTTTFDNYQIIINCTPLGTNPEINKYPELPYDFFTSAHIAFDLIYNPEETLFLKMAKERGAITKNGYEMLAAQAEKSWKTWNK